MPLAVMLISLFEHVDHSRKTIVYILDGGIKNSDRCKIIKSLGSETANIKFIKIDNKNLLDGVVVNGHWQVPQNSDTLSTDLNINNVNV